MGTFEARFGFVAIRAVDGTSEESGDGGLAGTARSSEEESLAESIGSEGVLQGTDDMALSDDIGEGLGAVFAVEGRGRHGCGGKEYVEYGSSIP